jgi:hypothetical protein
MGYAESQDFYVAHRQAFHLDRWESYAARWLYLDSRGKKRLSKPDLSRTTIKQAADQLVDAGQTRLGYDQMFRALERAIENAQTEVGERLAIRQDEVRRTVRLEASLAVSQLDISVIRLLREAQLFSRLAVGRASDDMLLNLKGVDKVRLTHIRKICPKVPSSPPRGRDAKERQALQAGQGSLF